VSLTIADVAAAAGVSAATVDRALNGRAGVHARTRDRVMLAAQRLGYVEAELVPPLPAPVTLAFVIPGGGNTFLAMLSDALLAAAAGMAGVSVALHRLDTYRPEALATGLRGVAAQVAGVGVVALDHPAVREAVRDLDAAGTPVLTLVSDISDVPRAAYVGIDNRAAGRLAGHLLGRCLGDRAGEVALFAGSLRYRGHEEREMGFRAICAEDFPGIVPLPAREIEDDTAQSYAAARAVLARHPELAGIYSLGGGNRGIAQALQESGRAGRVAFVGHELTQHTRRLLVSGAMHAVIDQDAAAEARLAVSLLARAARGQKLPATRTLRIHAVFRDNLPDLAIEPDNAGGNA
jgi:LacI family transcriptional regulator